MTKKQREMEPESDMDSLDSDEELQAAFIDDVLKPGLNVEVAPKKEYVNRKEDMKAVLQRFKQDLDWVQRLDIVTKAPAVEEKEEEEKKSPEDKSVHDDFQRELRFYKQAQAAVLEALPKINILGIKTRRPDDYFAEMAKSDRHMKRIREKLIAKEISMEKSEKAKKLRAARKFGKQVQVEVLKKRAQEKKKMLEEVKKFRKGQKDKLDFMVDLEDEDKKKNTKRKPKPVEKKDQFMPNKKRQNKNERFGFGGQKKRSKSNTADTFDKMTPIENMMMKQSSRRGTGKGPAGNKKGQKKPQQRLGKNRRLQNKFRNKNKKRV